MARVFVTDPGEQTKVPFLRGILTRSLQDSGLSFEQAYELASRVRRELAETAEISSAELRARVAAHLEREHGAELAERYQTPALQTAPILVRNWGGSTAPFSRSSHQRYLQSCGLAAEDARPVTQHIYEHLLRDGITQICSREIGQLTHARLAEELGTEIARRYLISVQLRRSGRPLLALIGGTVGCGKSTIATEVAHHFEIVRVQSTDMLREVMRMMVPERLLPVLHTSSFDAWRVQRRSELDSDPDTLLADGFRAQAELVAVPGDAVIDRALRERVSLILEGVHVDPAFMQRVPSDRDAIVVPIMLSVLKRGRLRKRIRGRGSLAPERRADRYLRNFDAIWSLQSFLLSQADQHGIPIIENDDKERATRKVITTVIDQVARCFSGTAEEIFALVPPPAKPSASGHS